MSKTQANTKVVVQEKNFGQTGKFVRENQKSLIFIVGAIVVMIVAYIAYQKFYIAPREITAANQMHVAQDFWEKKDWDKAIKGDAGYPGFEKIVSDYSNTKAGNLAYRAHAHLAPVSGRGDVSVRKSTKSLRTVSICL